ncbi:MAG TPA: hypothetical protein VJ957_12430, partial [Longimicrobiales bacterium]|nr:hypothetical protein [Longimicrobiales bacterium]
AGGQRDGGISWTSYFDTAAGRAHAALSGLATTATVLTYLRGQVLGNPAACLNARQVGYDPDRANDGSLTLKVEGAGDGDGLEWGLQLTDGVRTDTAAADGTSHDGGASTAYGAQAYLQVTAFTGTDVTVKVQHSTDNATWADLITFAQTTAAHTFGRSSVANTATVDRYVRAVTVTTGGFTSVSFAVVFCRNPVAGVVF